MGVVVVDTTSCILYINSERTLLYSAEASPAECCQHAKMLEDTQFVDGYKTLGFQETIYGEFLARMRENPRLVASCLVAGERLNQEHTQGVIHTVFTSLYGNCIMQEDESYLLQVSGPTCVSYYPFAEQSNDIGKMRCF